MTPRILYDFSVGQIAWYEKQTAFCKRQIAWCNDQLKRERARDKELQEYALQSCPDDEMTLRIFGGKYIGTETRKLMNERAKYYREIKHNEKRLAYYREQVAWCEKYIG